MKMQPVIKFKLKHDELACIIHYGKAYCFDYAIIQQQGINCLLYAVNLYIMEQLFNKKKQPKYTLTLTADQAKVFYEFWNFIDTSDFIYFNNIICNMILQIDLVHKKNRHLNNGTIF
jgi:hypothetical protein